MDVNIMKLEKNSWITLMISNIQPFQFI